MKIKEAVFKDKKGKERLIIGWNPKVVDSKEAEKILKKAPKDKVELREREREI